jgi:hypothetical protein
VVQPCSHLLQEAPVVDAPRVVDKMPLLPTATQQYILFSGKCLVQRTRAVVALSSCAGLVDIGENEILQPLISYIVISGQCVRLPDMAPMSNTYCGATLGRRRTLLVSDGDRQVCLRVRCASRSVHCRHSRTDRRKRDAVLCVQEGESNRSYRRLILVFGVCGCIMIFASMLATGRVLVRHLIDRRVEEYIRSRAA